MKSMSIASQISTAEEGARLFNTIAQVTRLLAAAYASGQKWSYEVSKLQATDGSCLGQSFDDGCTITIRIEPPETCNAK